MLLELVYVTLLFQLPVKEPLKNRSSWSPMVTNGAALDESAAIANMDVANIFFIFVLLLKFAFGGYCLVFPNF